jgi:hypothetical protein
MADLGAIEQAFLTSALALPEVKAVFDYEPARLDITPAVTLAWQACPSEPSSTGYSVVHWKWRVEITVSQTDFRQAIKELQNVSKALIGVVRSNPSLNGTCDWAFLNDEIQEAPISLEDNRGYRKSLVLTATTTEGM